MSQSAEGTLRQRRRRRLARLLPAHRVVPEDLEAWLDEARAAWRPGDTSAATLRRMSEAA